MEIPHPQLIDTLPCPKCNSQPIARLPTSIQKGDITQDKLIYCLNCDALFIREETEWVWIEIPSWAKKLIRKTVAYSKKRLTATTLKELAPYYEEQYFEGIKISAYNGCKRNVGNIVWEQCIIEEGVKTVLELGCAYGYEVKALRNKGIEAIGIDISKYALKKRCTDWLIRASVTHLPFKDKSFELAWSISTMEHIPERYMPTTVKELERVAMKQLHIISILQSPLTGDITHINEKPLEYWLKLTQWSHVELEKNVIALLHFGLQNLTSQSLLEHYINYKEQTT